MQTLNLVGAGKLGRTLARLWQRQQQFRIQQIVTRSQQTAQQAQHAIGAGQACRSDELQAADVWLIATPDDQIRASRDLIASHLSRDSLVFHCSGALTSEVLQPLPTPHVASAHPIHSFATDATQVDSLAGSYCAFEGDSLALATLIPAFEAIGLQSLRLEPQHKRLYHAASVMACNYLVGLMDASLDCFEAAGISRQLGQQLLLPLARQTLDNTLCGSPETALTGPIARGDVETVNQQWQALAAYDPLLGRLYQTLGQQTLQLAERQPADAAREARLQHLRALLQTPLLQSPTDSV